MRGGWAQQGRGEGLGAQALAQTLQRGEAGVEVHKAVAGNVVKPGVLQLAQFVGDPVLVQLLRIVK